MSIPARALPLVRCCHVQGLAQRDREPTFSLPLYGYAQMRYQSIRTPWNFSLHAESSSTVRSLAMYGKPDLNLSDAGALSEQFSVHDLASVGVVLVKPRFGARFGRLCKLQSLLRVFSFHLS